MRPMTSLDFDCLTRRDFANNAVLDEIHAALKERERLFDVCAKALRVMDGNQPMDSTANDEWFDTINELREVLGICQQCGGSGSIKIDFEHPQWIACSCVRSEATS